MKMTTASDTSTSSMVEELDEAKLSAPREEIFAALGSEARLQMLEMIAAHKEMCVCEMQDHFRMVQSAISAHLRVLRQAGLVKVRRVGFRVFYRVVPEVIEQAFSAFATVIQDKLAASVAEEPEARVEARAAAKGREAAPSQ